MIKIKGKQNKTGKTQQKTSIMTSGGSAKKKYFQSGFKKRLR